MDSQTIAAVIVTIATGLLLIATGLFSFIFAITLTEVAASYKYKKNTERFNPLLDKLLDQNSPTKDAIDLYKSIFNISDKDTPVFVSKIIVCLEDFKTWKLEVENKSASDQSISSHSLERRIKINKMIEEINALYPFADLKPENKIFFEGFKKVIDNKEFEACKIKLDELSKIFSGQNKEIENKEKHAKYANYLAIIGIVIGICGIVISIFR